jgi:protein-S-isoprenylcysteine O-methyltransferase Ste14
MTREKELIAATVFRVAVVIFLVGWSVLYLRRWDHALGVVVPAWLKVPGAAIMGASGFLVLWCAASLATCGILEQKDSRLLPHSLNTSGLFRFSRNPMSLSAVLLFLGLGLYCRSLSILLFSGVLFFFLHLVVVFVEEPKLRARFGDAYRDYEGRTRRWLPFTPRVR